MIKTSIIIILSISINKGKGTNKYHNSRSTYLQWEVILSLLKQHSIVITIHSPYKIFAFNLLYQQLAI